MQNADRAQTNTGGAVEANVDVTLLTNLCKSLDDDDVSGVFSHHNLISMWH